MLQDATATLTISAVERDTGLSKDTLRMWERRYRFPQPLRDLNGERAYPPVQVDKLRLIKRLLDRGMRPGRIVPKPLDELLALGQSRDARSVQLGLEQESFLSLLRTHRLEELRSSLTQVLGRHGLRQFVLDTVAPLTVAVGDAWMRGELAVFEEHLYTEQVKFLLRRALSAIEASSRGPRVLFTTLPGESHGLGLLMAESIIAIEGAYCIALGTETPLAEIQLAAAANQVDVVALSFSSSFGGRAARSALAQLRAHVPDPVAIWAGGAALARARTAVAGVTTISSLEQAGSMVKDWRFASTGRAR